MSAFSVDTGRRTTLPFVDGVVHNRLVQQTMNIYYVISNTFFK